MTAVQRLALAACSLSFVVLPACAVKFAPSRFNPGVKASIPSETSLDLVANTGGGCRKENGPFAMIGLSNSDVTWKVTNKCGQDATVFIEQFKIKHKWFHLYPFQKELGGVPVKNGETVSITARVRDTSTVEDEDYKGLQVYKYRVRIIAGTHENKHDPEIIIEWP